MDRIVNPRDIIHRKALSARLDAIAEDQNPKSPAGRMAAFRLVKEALDGGRAEVLRRLDEGASGLDIARANAYLIDQIVRTLYDHVWWHVYRATNPTAGEHLSIVAVGGYGRGEMAPHSDVDLLFLHPHKVTAWVEQVIEYILYMLWDFGLKVGQATRSVDDCLRLAKSDISVRTAVLEARFVWGDQDLFEELRSRFAKEIVAGSGASFVEAKLAERDERHLRLGDSRYLVEPNIKDGKGGLRDLHTLFWIGKYVHGVQTVDELVGKGVLTKAELARFRRAERYLWSVRCHLHHIAGRPEERLTFDVQPELARRLKYREDRRASAVERFMKHYYLVAKNVGDLTRIFCATLEEQHRHKPRLRFPRLGLFRRAVEGFVDERGRLNVADDDAFATDPVNMIRLFHVAQENDRDIHPRALQLITRNLKRIKRAVRRDPEANRLFLEILTSRNDPETTLRRMNEAGVLGRFMPDFGRVVAQMQHDMYHVYTVDEHTIRAIGVLSRIESGDPKDEHPLASEIIGQVGSRRTLYLAVLLHDIAKGRGGDHSELGAEVAQRLGARLGLEDTETETVVWLVRHHLVMSHTAFKRDVGDPKTVADFVELVQSRERLRLLLVLTVADIRAVGPGRWNAWKGELLHDLYHSAEESLSGGHVAAPRADRLAEARKALRESLPEWTDDEVAHHFARSRESYWLSTDTATAVRHARIMREADEAGRGVTVSSEVDKPRGITEVTVYAQDHPGLFARVTGAIAVCGGNIVDAKIHTTSDGMVIDTFAVQGADRHSFDEPERLARLKRIVDDALSGRLDIERELGDRTGLPSRAHVFRVRPNVLTDNTASNLHTVIEVYARDRPGLLFDVTKAISRLGLTIASAHITTYGERAVDVFYVKDVFGLKVSNDAKLERIREELMAALGAPDDAPQSESGLRAASAAE